MCYYAPQKASISTIDLTIAMESLAHTIRPRSWQLTWRRLQLVWLVISLFLCIYWLSCWSDNWWLPFLKDGDPFIEWVKLSPGEQLEWQHWGQVLNFYLAVCSLGWAVFWMSYQTVQPKWLFGMGLGLLILLFELGLYLFFTGHLMAATPTTIGAAVLLGIAAYVLIRRSKKLAFRLPVVEYNDLASATEVDANQVHEIDQLSANNRVKAAALSQFCADLEQQIARLTDALLEHQPTQVVPYQSMLHQLRTISSRVRSLSNIQDRVPTPPSTGFDLAPLIASLTPAQRATLAINGPLQFAAEPLLVKALFDVGMEVAFWGAKEAIDWQVSLSIDHQPDRQTMIIWHNNPMIEPANIAARLETMASFLTGYPDIAVANHTNGQGHELQFVVQLAKVSNP
jgi:hypothetical protein